MDQHEVVDVSEPVSKLFGSEYVNAAGTLARTRGSQQNGTIIQLVHTGSL